MERRTFLKLAAGTAALALTENLEQALASCKLATEGTRYGMIGVHGVLFEPGNDRPKDERCFTPTSKLIAPAPNRRIKAYFTDDPRWFASSSEEREKIEQFSVFQTVDFLIRRDGNGWGVNPATGEAYDIDDNKPVYTVRYDRPVQKWASVPRYNDNTIYCEEAIIGYVLDRLNSTGSAYRLSGELIVCDERIMGNHEEVAFHTNINLYGAKDYLLGLDNQIVRARSYDNCILR